MANFRSTVMTIMLAGYCWQPAIAGNETETAATAAAQNKIDEIKLSLYSHRRTPNLYWRIDSSGKGEISAPQGVGYQVASPLIVSPVYRIAPGLHQFDIGEAGYSELRDYLTQIIDGKYDRYGLTDGECTLRNTTDSGWVELDWSGSTKGELHLSHDCLNGLGDYFHDRMVLAWHKLAHRLHGQGNSLVTIEPQPAMRAPSSLSFTKKNVWTAATTTWHMAANGKGWIEFSQDQSVPTLTLGDMFYVKAGRYPFQLDSDFYQSILRELDPYLSRAKTDGSCESELSMTDQPMVRIEWKYKAAKAASFVSDMGCPSFAERFRKVELVFAELIRNGNLGNSRIMLKK